MDVSEADMMEKIKAAAAQLAKHHTKAAPVIIHPSTVPVVVRHTTPVVTHHTTPVVTHHTVPVVVTHPTVTPKKITPVVVDVHHVKTLPTKTVNGVNIFAPKASKET